MSEPAPPPTHPNPPLVAHARLGYCMRLLVVGLGMWVASAWFAFDASVTYPRHNAQYAQVEAFEKQHGGEASALWSAHAKEAGLDPNYNAAKSTKHSKMDVLTQWVLCAATTVFGLLFVAGYLLARRRFVRWNGVELSNHQHIHIKAEDIIRLDDSRWKEKGVARVCSETHTITLDDWKMDPAATEALYEAMLALVNSRQPTP